MQNIPKLPSPSKARGKSGLSVRELSRLAGIGEMTIRRAEERGTWPKYITIRNAYLKALGLP